MILWIQSYQKEIFIAVIGVCVGSLFKVIPILIKKSFNLIFHPKTNIEKIMTMIRKLRFKIIPYSIRIGFFPTMINAREFCSMLQRKDKNNALNKHEQKAYLKIKEYTKKYFE